MTSDLQPLYSKFIFENRSIVFSETLSTTLNAANRIMFYRYNIYDSEQILSHPKLPSIRIKALNYPTNKALLSELS